MVKVRFTLVHRFEFQQSVQQIELNALTGTFLPVGTMFPRTTRPIRPHGFVLPIHESCFLGRR